MNTIEKITYRGLEIEIVVDKYPEDPREWDNLGTMLTRHRDYNLGDAIIPESYYNDHLGQDIHIEDMETLSDYIEQEYGEIAIIKPLYLLDHSGLWLSTSRFMSDPGGWDTSHIGVIFATKEDLRKEYRVKRITKSILDRANGVLNNEVEVYGKYISGDIMGWVTDNDSCWGYYDYDSVISDAKESIDYQLEQESKKRQKTLKAYIKNRVPLNYRFI